MKLLRKVLSIALALLFMLSLSVTAFAETYNINEGSISVSAGSDGTTVSQNGNDHTETGQTIITGGDPTSNTISISADAGYTASVTLDGVNISTGTWGDAAVSVSGSGDVILELDGTNTVTSGESHAGVEKSGDGSLTITDDSGTDGSLTANGGVAGAGIGGGYGGDGTDITITGGTVNANGGWNGAGIGGGYGGDGTNITIEDGTVNATGDHGGAGIGGGYGGSGDGYGGNGTDITISGGTVTATSVNGTGGAGIGGAEYGNGSNITISGGTVYVAGLSDGAGIGGGGAGTGSDITVSGDAQVHVAEGTSHAYSYWDYGPGAAIGNGGGITYDGTPAGPGEEVEPDIDGLYTTGSITTYPAGTSIEQMKNGTVQGTTISGIIDPPPQPEPAPSDVAADPFLGFCLAVAEKIKAAPENGTLEINAGRYTGFVSFVLEALARRPDLTLTVTWKQGGADQTLTIPAGTDLSSLSGSTVLFTDIAELVG